MTSVATARDVMLADATNACSGLTVVYKDAPPAGLDGKTNWARATVKHAGGGQEGFGDGTRKYCRLGTLCIEIFTVPGDGLVDQDLYIDQVMTYIEGRSSSLVWYRNIRASEAGMDGGYEKTNIYADFEYESHH